MESFALLLHFVVVGKKLFTEKLGPIELYAGGAFSASAITTAGTLVP